MRYSFDSFMSGLLRWAVSPETLKPIPDKPDPFGFTEHEKLWDRVSHERFLSILESEQTSIHRAEVSSNTFGEFLFVTTSRDEAEKTVYVTFWGLGYHDYRERWVADEWYWNRDDTYPESLLGSLPRIYFLLPALHADSPDSPVQEL